MRRERLAEAQWSRDLGEAEEGELGDVDIVRAMGAVAQVNDLGVILWRVRYGGATRELRSLAEKLVSLMDRHQRDSSVVATVLEHWLGGICRACHGRGYEVVPGTPMLSDVICPSCHGTGKTELIGAGVDGEWLLEQMAASERLMAAAVMRKLSTDLDVLGLGLPERPI